MKTNSREPKINWAILCEITNTNERRAHMNKKANEEGKSAHSKNIYIIYVWCGWGMKKNHAYQRFQNGFMVILWS